LKRMKRMRKKKKKQLRHGSGREKEELEVERI